MSIYESKDKEVAASRVIELISDASITVIEKIFNDNGFKLIERNFDEREKLHKLLYSYNADNYSCEAHVKYKEGSLINIKLIFIGALIFRSMENVEKINCLVNSISGIKKWSLLEDIYGNDETEELPDFDEFKFNVSKVVPTANVDIPKHVHINEDVNM